MRKKLQHVYRKVGKETFYRGMRNGMRLMALLLLFVLLCIVAGCRKEEKKGQSAPLYLIPGGYEMSAKQIVWETSPDNHRVKVPVLKDVQVIVWEVPR